MTEHSITIPEVILVAGTRVALGAGIGILLAQSLGRDARKAVGIALTVFGALTTIPLVMEIKRKNRSTLESIEGRRAV